jgi:DNA-binding CsgD family transcriptional regulator
MGNRLEWNDVDIQAVIQRVSTSPDGVYSLYDVWNNLIHGVWEIVAAPSDETNCYLISRQVELRRSPVKPQQCRILEGVLHGNCPKRLAIDLGVACSTISTSAKLALTKIGIECLPSRVPLPIVVVAQGSDDRERTLMGAISMFTRENRLHNIISVHRPDRHLCRYLPPAEVEVMRARLEGLSHQRIARVRHTSERTVANQLASAARRLGVSGRLDTIGHLSQQYRATMVPQLVSERLSPYEGGAYLPA